MEAIMMKMARVFKGHLTKPSSPRRRGSSAFQLVEGQRRWIPAFAGMTSESRFVQTFLGWKVLAVMLALLVLPCAPVLAFVDPPTFSPAQPYARQPIDMSVRAGGCHGFAAPPEEIPFLEVQISGNVVDVIIGGVVAYDPILCVFGVGTLTVDIGTLPQGNYTVRVRIRDVDPPYEIYPPASEAALSVRGATAVPASREATLIVLAGLIAGLALFYFRRRTD